MTLDLFARRVGEPQIGTAIFWPSSAERIHRVYLDRPLKGAGGDLVVIGWNPSKADEYANDPTITRMIVRGNEGGFSRLCMLNTESFIATNPDLLPDDLMASVAPTNDQVIYDMVKRPSTSMVVCGWGTKARRGNLVEQMLRSWCVPLHAFRISKHGHPEHPLYLSYSIKPTPWERHA